MNEQTYTMLDGRTQEERIDLFLQGLSEGWAELDTAIYILDNGDAKEVTFMRRVKTGERYILLEADVQEMIRRGLIEPKSKQ